MRQIVSDTGPLLHLREAECLNLLEQAGTIAIPTAVHHEMVQHVPEWHVHTPSWITVTPVSAPYDAQATEWQQSGLLEAGEAEAIALARQLSAAWLLTDDAAARGHLSREEAAVALDRLAHSSLWISARVLADARVALDSLFT